ncbi:MAG: hypothetical protein JXQ72_08395 [Anaerolineae bacterium]|nr:hypothetical protein [Anaerolineae bacterium]
MRSNPRRRVAIGPALVAFLVAVYFFTFNGYAISRDEWFLFDATESMARRGNMGQNYEFDAYPPVTLDEAQPPSADTEPLQPVLAAPLFLVAQALPGIGLAHTVWLFNVLTTALTAGVLYAYGLALGYRARVAALTALAFGLGTIAWPYSRTFFREPLFTLLALLSAYLMMRVRQRLAAGERPFLTLAGFALAFAGALFSKEATLLLVPVILVEALPTRRRQIRFTRRTILALAGLTLFAGAIFAVVLHADTLFGISNRYAFAQRLDQLRENVSDTSEGLSGYLFSPARSMWIFSPVLLVGFWGCARLVRQNRWRQVAVPLVMIVSFAVGYAAVRGSQRWYGGLGWGPRYLVPVTPFAALWLLPVFRALLTTGTATWKRVGVGAVFLISAGIQILAVLVSILHYYAVLDAEQPPVVPWKEGAWNPQWAPIYITLKLLDDHKIDLAWNYAVGDSWILPVGCVILAILAMGWLGWWLRRDNGSRRTAAITTGSLGLAAILVLGLGLFGIRKDPRYGGHFQPARDLLSLLENRIAPDDVIVLNDFTYAEFFMNYYKRTEPVIYTLPISPGERPSPEQTPEVESSHPDALIHRSGTLVLADLGQRHKRLWLVINSSPFIPWSVRPVEHYLSRYYFPVEEVKSTDTARAVRFDMTPAPPPTALLWPEHPVNAQFGENPGLQLTGYDIPGGTTRQAGDVLPVSLLWETLAPVPEDYTVALLLMAGDQLVAQRDSFPVNAFEHTQNWRPGSLHRDNHGLQLPDTLPPGEYELWLALYWWQAPTNRLPVSDADGNSIGDHVVLTRVTIE